ncbi:MAG: prolyl oligopeptidase family serine peptidase [Pseudomonadota bacterium]
MARVITIICLCLLTGIAAAQTPLPGLSNFTDRDRYSQIRMSPDGQALVYFRYNSVAKKNMIEFADATSGKILSFIPARNYVPSRLEWIDDRRAVTFGGGRLYSLSLDGSELQPLLTDAFAKDERRFGRSVFQKRLDYWWFIGPIPGDDENVLIGSRNKKEQMRVHRMNLFSGRIRDIVDGGEERAHNWYLNSQGMPVVGVREDKRSSTFLIRQGDQWEEHDKVHTDGAIQLDHTTDVRSGSARIVMALDNDRDVLLSVRGADGIFDLVVYDVVAGQVKTGFHDESRYSLRSQMNDLRVIRDSADGRLAAIHYVALDNETITHHEDLLAAIQLLRRDFPESSFTPVAGSSAANRWLFDVHDRAFGSQYVSVEPAAETTTVVFNENPSDTSERLPTFSAFRIPARDGYEIDTYLWTPQEEVTRKPPILLVQHAAGSRHYPAYDIDALYLASRGHPVVMTNPRGLMGYGLAQRKAGLENQQALLISDLVDAADWARNNVGTDSGDVYALGLRLGGQSVFTTAIQSSKTFAAIAGYNMPVDLLELRDYLDDEDYYEGLEYLDLSGEGSRSVKKALRELSPLESVESLSVPTFAFHAARSEVISADDFERFAEAGERVSDTFDHSIIAERLTGFEDPGVRERYLELILRFFDRHGSGSNNP